MRFIINLLSSKSRQFRIALAWGIFAFFFAGLIVAPVKGQTKYINAGKFTDLAYHYHTSAIATMLVSMLILGILGTLQHSYIRRSPTREIHWRLSMLDIFALAGGILIVYSGGWLKEILDALGGKFADSRDLEADLTGIIRQAVYSLSLALPVHIFLALSVDRLRRFLVTRMTPKKAHEKLKEAHKIENKLHSSMKNIKNTHHEINQVREQIHIIEEKLAAFTPEQRAGKQGSQMLCDLNKRQERIDELLKRVAGLEAENQHLNHNLKALVHSIRQHQGAELANRELQIIFGVAIEQTAMLAQVKGEAEIAAKQATNSIELIAPAKKENSQEKEIKSIVANTEKAVSPPLAETENKLVEELNGQLTLRNAQAREMEAEIGKLKSEAEMLQIKLKELSPARVQELENRINKLYRNILIVDDDITFCGMIRTMLTDSKMLRVEAVQSVMEAVEIMKGQTTLPDLLILDVNMPKISGTKLCSMLMEAKNFSHIPIVFCTGMDATDIPELGKLNFVDVIKKPVKIQRLYEVVSKALNLNL